ncbi:hypothetical protein NIES3585_23610 [Nodularia sp. NIES-3585]|nr:hypothetical protein NIES3585_23610 [Nodularia sp. NIES-3585]
MSIHPLMRLTHYQNLERLKAAKVTHVAYISGLFAQRLPGGEATLVLRIPYIYINAHEVCQA